MWHIFFVAYHSNERVIFPRDDTKVSQSYAVSIISKLVLSDRGVAIVHDSDAIPRLVELLDPNPEWGHEIACQSLLILSHMADHQRPCMAMVKAGVIPPLGRLPSQPMSDDVIVLAVRTVSRCSRQFLPGKVFRGLFLPSVLQPLIKLLYSNKTELWVAAVEAIDRIANVPDKEISQYLDDEDVAQQLCHLFFKCTDIHVLEKLASAIGFTTRSRDYYAVATHVIDEQVLQPLISLLGSCSVEDQIGACRSLRLCHSEQLMDNYAEIDVIPPLISLLSSESHELFVGAAWAALFYTRDYTETADYINFAMFQRLIRVLSCGNELVVANAARCLSKFLSCEEKFGSRLVYEMLSSGGLRRLVGLISSHNMDLAVAAIEAIESLRSCDWGIYERSNLVYRRLGVITAIVRCATSGLYSPAELEDLFGKVYWYLELNEAQALAQAGLIFPLVDLLSSQDGIGVGKLVRIISWLAVHDNSYETMLLDAGIARPLITTLSYFLRVDDPEFATDDGVRPILRWINHSSVSHPAFKVAGVEGVLSAYLTARPTSKYREEVERALASLSSCN
jgi:hypothetical protein